MSRKYKMLQNSLVPRVNTKFLFSDGFATFFQFDKLGNGCSYLAIEKLEHDLLNTEKQMSPEKRIKDFLSIVSCSK